MVKVELELDQIVYNALLEMCGGINMSIEEYLSLMLNQTLKPTIEMQLAMVEGQRNLQSEGENQFDRED